MVWCGVHRLLRPQVFSTSTGLFSSTTTEAHLPCLIGRSHHPHADNSLRRPVHRRFVCARRPVLLDPSSSSASAEVQLRHCGMRFRAHLHAVWGQWLGLQQTPTSRLYIPAGITLCIPSSQILLERFTHFCAFPIRWFSFQARMVVRLSCSTPVHSVRFTGCMTAVQLTLVRCSAV